MTTRIWKCVFIWLAVGVLGLLGGDVPAGEVPLCGVVVEEIADGSALAKAGLLAGDVVLSWERLPSPPANPEGEQGEIASPFDWLWMEVEQAPRGTVKLRGERDAEPIAFVVEPGLWDAKVRPRMSGPILDAYLKGRELIEAEQLEEGTSSWRQAAEIAQQDEDWPLRCWLWLRVGQVCAEARIWEKAEEAYEQAWKEAREPKAQVAVREASGDAFRKQSQWKGAEEAYRWALETRKAIRRESLGVGQNMGDIGWVALTRGDPETAEGYFQRALEITEKLAPGSLDHGRSLYNMGLLASDRGDLEVAEGYLRHALEITEKLAPNSLKVTRILGGLGEVFLGRGEPRVAEGYFRRSVEITEKLAPDSRSLAVTLYNLGLSVYTVGDPEPAALYFQRALEITENLAPNSLELAAILNLLAMTALDQDDFATAEEHYQRALEIAEKVAPNSHVAAASIHNLGEMALERRDFVTAEGYLRRALEITEKLAPDSLDVAVVLSNLGGAASGRGDLAVAEAYLRRALDIQKRLAPKSLSLVSTLNSLGNVASRRRDLEAAQAYYELASTIAEQRAPNSLGLCISLMNLGALAGKRGDLTTMEGYLQRALAIRKTLNSNSLSLVNLFTLLGNIPHYSGDLAAAEPYYKRGLEISEEMAANSLHSAAVLHNLGDLASDRGDLEAAERYYQRSLPIMEKLAPNTTKHAGILFALGNLFRKSGRLRQASDLFKRAFTALEGQIGRLGGSYELQSTFRTRYQEIYHQSIQLLLELKRPEDAFHTLERSRARSFLAMLAERDLVFTTDIPEDLEKARKVIAGRHDRILEQMATLDSEKDREAVDELSKELRTIQRERDDVVARIREASPRLADLQYPQPLTLPQVQDVLDPGTVMLSYSVGEDQTYVFVVTKEKGLVVAQPLAMGEDKLRAAVDDFRYAIVHGTDPRSQFFQPVTDAGRKLYKVLIRPVASSIEKSDRVLIIPDGPLHLLPFSALIRESGQYLAEWKPLHFVLSATLHGELKRTRPQLGDSPSMVAAFGDPVYPEIVRRENPDQIADVRVRAAVKRGLFDWEPLPHTRREVEGIAALYPAKRVRRYLGEEATEERAKGLPRTTDVVHFAGHGHLDDRSPLDSAVVLTIPEGFPEDRDNGLLQAWEIFERLRIDADLVVLSACDSALGEERGGEGLIGLTRAFQYAGARTVVASLWKVADEATAELMVRFYHHLRAGKSKDAALQAAQIELIRGPIQVRRASGKVVQRNASAPYYWAAFQVIGDWR